MEGLCDDVGKYVLASINLSVRGKQVDHWLKSIGEEADDMVNATAYTPSHVQSNKQRMLKNYCGAFLEEREDELEDAIRGGKFEDPGEIISASCYGPISFCTTEPLISASTGVIEDFVCKDMIKACPDGSLPRVWIDEPPLEGAEKAAEEERMQQLLKNMNEEMKDGGMSQEDLSARIKAMKAGKDKDEI